MSIVLGVRFISYYISQDTEAVTASTWPPWISFTPTTHMTLNITGRVPYIDTVHFLSPSFDFHCTHTHSYLWMWLLQLPISSTL